MRGYGGTEAPGEYASYNAYNLAADALGLLQRLGIECVALVGHDHGAELAIAIAVTRILALALTPTLAIAVTRRQATRAPTPNSSASPNQAPTSAGSCACSTRASSPRTSR